MTLKKNLVFWMRVALGMVFIAASLDKAMHPQAFAKIIFNYQILPDYLVNLTAIILPWLEIVVGFLLIAGWYPMGTTALATFVLAVFFGALTFNLLRGLNVNCGCFSTSDKGDPANWLTLMRDGAFLAAGVFLLVSAILKEKQSAVARSR